MQFKPLLLSRRLKSASYTITIYAIAVIPQVGPVMAATTPINKSSIFDYPGEWMRGRDKLAWHGIILNQLQKLKERDFQSTAFIGDLYKRSGSNGRFVFIGPSNEPRQSESDGQCRSFFTSRGSVGIAKTYSAASVHLDTA